MSAIKNTIESGVRMFNDLPRWSRGIVAVGTLAIVGITGYTVWNKIQKASQAKKANQLASDAKKELAVLSSKGVKPTITQTQAETFSSKLVKAFDDFGTDEQAVYDVMSAMKNQADILYLIQVYGVRKFKGTFSSWFDFEELNLPAAISYEMDSSEIAKVNSILSKKGITFKF